MNTHDPNPLDPMLDAFLDGTLSPAEQIRMRRRITADPQLLAECERHRTIDASLSRLFAPPTPVAPPAEPVSPAQAQTPPRRLVQSRADPRQRLRLAAKVAIIVIGLGYAGWVFADFLVSSSLLRSQPQTQYRYSAPQSPTTFAAAYHDIVYAGFQPDWICETDAQFADTFATRLGQPMQFRPDPPATTMAGLSYQWVLSPNTVVMLGTAHGSRALVFVDRIEHDQNFSLPPDSGLNLFRKQVGDLVLYEVTPRDTPALLDGFNLPLAACH